MCSGTPQPTRLPLQLWWHAMTGSCLRSSAVCRAGPRSNRSLSILPVNLTRTIVAILDTGIIGRAMFPFASKWIL